MQCLTRHVATISWILSYALDWLFHPIEATDQQKYLIPVYKKRVSNADENQVVYNCNVTYLNIQVLQNSYSSSCFSESNLLFHNNKRAAVQSSSLKLFIISSHSCFEIVNLQWHSIT